MLLKVGMSGKASFVQVRADYPSPILTTDNAAMIAAAGTPKFLQAVPMDLHLNAYADLRLC